jgi:hypothetical protein
MDLNSTNEGSKWFNFSIVYGDNNYYLENKDGYYYTWKVSNVTKTSITF